MDKYSNEQHALWETTARMQGMVCLVCNEPPKLPNRAAFYDSGLCRRCAAELAADRRVAGASPGLA